MSDPLSPTDSLDATDALVASAPDAAPPVPLAAPVLDAPGAPNAPTSTAPADALVDLLRRGLVPDADPVTRAAAREMCTQILQALGGPAPAPAAPPVALVPAPVATVMPTHVLPAPPVSRPPLATVIDTLRGLPQETLLDMAIQRLRTALPAGAKVAEPRGIHFALVPMTSPGGTP